MKALFRYVKDYIDIVDVISHYIALFPVGNYFKGLSPFKQEKTASFTVTPGKKIFYCFSTHIGGDVIDFVSRMENCSQYQAAMILIQRYSISVDKSIFHFNKNNMLEEKNNYFKIYEMFVFWTQKKLKENKLAQEYLKKRGITDSSLIKYAIGYCPDSTYIYDFLQSAQKESILLDEILKTNIIQKKGKNLFFTCQDRILFPIQNVLNVYCAYGSRVFLEHDTRPKYINSIASNEFIKKKLVYGLTQAKLKIKETKMIYLVEGYIDVIMMAQAGYENTVATMGTAISKQHVEYIKKFVNTIVIVYDGDEAGYFAITKSIALFWNESIDVFIVLLPLGEDPASLVKKGLMQDIIVKKISAMHFFLQEKKKVLQGNSLKNIHELVIDIIAIIDEIDDEKKKLSLIMKASVELSINQEYLISILKNKNTIKKIETVKKGEQANISIANDKNLDNVLFKIDTDKKEKVIWYLFFYLTLYFYNKNNITTKKSIFLLNNFGIDEFKFILKDYFNIYSEYNSFLDFFKEYNKKLYNHCIKIMSMYNFSYLQYEIIFNKIVFISWKEYKMKNLNMQLKDFLFLLDAL